LSSADKISWQAHKILRLLVRERFFSPVVSSPFAHATFRRARRANAPRSANDTRGIYILHPIRLPAPTMMPPSTPMPLTTTAVHASSCPEDVQQQRRGSSAVSLATVAVTESYQPLPTKPSGKEGAEVDAAEAEAAATYKKSQRIDTAAIDGIRTIACVAIACGHWLSWYGEKKHGAIEVQVSSECAGRRGGARCFRERRVTRDDLPPPIFHLRYVRATRAILHHPAPSPVPRKEMSRNCDSLFFFENKNAVSRPTFSLNCFSRSPVHPAINLSTGRPRRDRVLHHHRVRHVPGLRQQGGGAVQAEAS
jgi:hypothetical protein